MMGEKMPCPVCEQRADDEDWGCYLCDDTEEVPVVALKDCPLCGCDGQYFVGDVAVDADRNTVVGFVSVWCPGCGTKFALDAHTPSRAAEIFNRRADAALLQQVEEALDDFCQDCIQANGRCPDINCQLKVVFTAIREHRRDAP